MRAFAWWRDWSPRGRARTFAVAAELAGAGLVIATAFFGGQLVYDLGVNVSHAAGA